MSYSSAIDQLSAMTPELHTQPGQPRRKFSLAEIGILLEALGNPHHRFRSVLIAGTNGKGSTAATLASILQESGLRTGLYTSPHLTRPNERIRINGDEISNDAFASIYFRVHAAAQKLIEEGKLHQSPSFFEHLTAMAFLYFAGEKVDIGVPTDRSTSVGCDFAVLEVGLGGRLDATNITDPLISVITDISLDHTEWLGSTIDAIAREKAGILRPNGTLITLPQHPEANHAIGGVATALNVRAISAVPYMPALATDADQDVYTITALGTSIPIASPLHGAHQHRNIALAIATAIELGFRHGVPITPASIANGVRDTRWPARLETITTLSATGREIQWLLDVAHNPAGAWALRAALSSLERQHGPVAKPSVLIFSCLRDKPVTELAQILFPLFDQIIFAPIQSVRATPTPDLLAAAAATGTPATTAASISEALALAERFALSESASTTNPGAPGPFVRTWEGTSNEAMSTTEMGAPCLPQLETRESTREAQSAPRVVVSGSVYLVGEARPLLLARAASSVERKAEAPA
jgi:dihydrofolate synthase / folylpolyglutamate synthase